MTSYLFNICDTEIEFPVEEMNKVIRTYHQYNTFFQTECLVNGCLVELAPSLLYSDVLPNEKGESNYLAAYNALFEKLLTSAMCGTIVICASRDLALHCGVSNNRMYIRVIDDTSHSTELESIYLDDDELGKFILRNCHKPDEEYIESIYATRDMYDL